MRPRAPILALLLIAVACATGGRPTELGGPVVLAEAARDAAATETVERFLRAYAEAPLDGALDLSELAGSPVVAHWAAWLGIQYAQIGGVTGAVDIRSIGVGRSAPTAEGAPEVLYVPIQASVTFRVPSSSGATLEQVRVLDGTVALVPDPEGAWRVADFTRDGVPLSASVFVFDPESGASSVTERGVTIRVDSFIQDASEWAVGVLVRNEGERDVRITEGTVGLVDATGSLVVSGNPPAGAEVVAPGTTEEALVAFQIPADEELVGLRFFVGAIVAPSDPPVFMVVPIQPILRSLREAGAPPEPVPSAPGTA
jgi:hypothetical protein